MPPARCRRPSVAAVTFTTNGRRPNRQRRAIDCYRAPSSCAGRSRVSTAVSFRAWRRRKEILEIGGREVVDLQPAEGLLPGGRATRSSTSSTTTSRSPTARCAASRGRPMALKRFVDGAAGEPFFQKRAPGQHARLDPDRRADLPVRPDRRRDRRRRRGRPGLGRQPRLHRPQPAPGPRRRPRPSRRAARRPRPGAGRAVGADPRGRAGVRARRSRPSGWSAGRRPPARAASTSTSGSSRAGRTRRSAGRPSRSPATSSAACPTLATSKWWKEERHGVFLDYNQNAKDRTVASAYSVRPLPDARVSTPLTWDEVPTVEAEAFTLATVPARFAAIGDPGAGIDEAVGSLEALLELSAPARGRGPGRRAVAAELREAGRRAAAGPAVAQAPPGRRVRAGPRRGGRAAAGGRRGAGRRRRGRRPERRPADRVGRLAPDADRPAQDDRSRSSRSRGRRPRPRRWRASSAGRRATRRRPTPSSRPTSSSTGCAAARRSGTASGST